MLDCHGHTRLRGWLGQGHHLALSADAAQRVASSILERETRVGGQLCCGGGHEYLVRFCEIEDASSLVDRNTLDLVSCDLDLTGVHCSSQAEAKV